MWSHHQQQQHRVLRLHDCSLSLSSRRQQCQNPLLVPALMLMIQKR
jgi:hypothetical protein